MVKVVADPLEPGGVVGGQEAVVERLEGDAGGVCLLLGEVVAVEADLGVVGKVGGELDEERAEVGVEAVEVEVVDHRGAADQPGKRRAGLGIAALLGPKRRGLLLRAADEQDPLGAVVAGKVALGDVVFALAGTEVDQWDVVVVDVAVDGGDERPW